MGVEILSYTGSKVKDAKDKAVAKVHREPKLEPVSEPKAKLEQVSEPKAKLEPEPKPEPEQKPR